jgi:hypothetical protein
MFWYMPRYMSAVSPGRPNTTISVIGTGVSIDPTHSYSFQVGRVAGTTGDFTINGVGQFNFTDSAAVPDLASLHVLSSGQVYLNFGYTPVPEPSLIIASAVGFAGLYRAGRRWRARRGSERPLPS